MQTLFWAVLEKSLSAVWLIAAVVLLRLVFYKASRRWMCLLWGFVGIRLCVSYTAESPIGLVPDTAAAVGSVASAPSGADVAQMISWVWITGALGLVAYAVITFLLLRRRVTEAAHMGEGVYLCDRIDTPFLLGLFRPRIFLPSALSAEQARYVVAHERTHAKRLDHLWKPLGFSLLIVHWFNPLVWLAYLLLCRDMELACDEAVVCGMSLEERKGYSRTLLACSMPHRGLAAYPVAFGEGKVKHRIRAVLSYRKSTLAATVAVGLITAVTVVCFMTSPLPQSANLPIVKANTGWTLISDFYGNGTNHLCAYREMKAGNGTAYTYVVMEEDGVYYAGEYLGSVDPHRISINQQRRACEAVYSYAAVDDRQNRLILYRADGTPIMQ